MVLSVHARSFWALTEQRCTRALGHTQTSRVGQSANRTKVHMGTWTSHPNWSCRPNQHTQNRGAHVHSDNTAGIHQKRRSHVRIKDTAAAAAAAAAHQTLQTRVHVHAEDRAAHVRTQQPAAATVHASNRTTRSKPNSWRTANQPPTSRERHVSAHSGAHQPVTIYSTINIKKHRAACNNNQQQQPTITPSTTATNHKRNRNNNKNNNNNNNAQW